jgi:lipoprotein-releasing system ATP-binding protein
MSTTPTTTTTTTTKAPTTTGGGPERPADAATPVMRLRGLTKDFGEGETLARVLKGIDLEIGRHDFAALIGPSGSGKSTLLNILGLLDRPTAGLLEVNGIDASGFDDAARTHLRGQTLGFIFQFHHLLPAFSALENVLMPIRVVRPLKKADVEWGRHLLAEVGLADKEKRKPNELSGGQQQRVAIARALAPRPALILADEPTGNLDTESSAQAFALMEKAHKEYDCAFLIVTHDPRIAARCRRVVEIVDGRIQSDTGQRPTA